MSAQVAGQWVGNDLGPAEQSVQLHPGELGTAPRRRRWRLVCQPEPSGLGRLEA